MMLLAGSMMFSLAAGGSTEATSARERSVPLRENTDAESRNEDGGNNMLIAYFSLAGEQYRVGVIEEGNTSIVANMIREQTGADLFRIEAVDQYPASYDELLDVSRQEMAGNARPEIAGRVENLDDYDTIFIGYPIWWGDLPSIVSSFLESYDFSDKTIVPFCTHGGSGLARTVRTIGEITGGNMMDGLAIAGTTAQNERERARAEVTSWLREGGFIE